jgi:cytochrome c553
MTVQGSHGSRLRTTTTIALLALLGAGAVAVAQQGELTGDAARGQRYFTDGYKCYACHGYDAVSGARRLLPMNYTQDGFITFVQNSPLPQMPAYNDMPAQALADVYAYIRSMPTTAAEVENIPLLNEILDRKLDALGD